MMWDVSSFAEFSLGMEQNAATMEGSNIRLVLAASQVADPTLCCVDFAIIELVHWLTEWLAEDFRFAVSVFVPQLRCEKPETAVARWLSVTTHYLRVRRLDVMIVLFSGAHAVPPLCINKGNIKFLVCWWDNGPINGSQWQCLSLTHHGWMHGKLEIQTDQIYHFFLCLKSTHFEFHVTALVPSWVHRVTVYLSGGFNDPFSPDSLDRYILSLILHLNIKCFYLYLSFFTEAY